MLGDLIGEILFKVQRQKLHLRGDVASTIVSMSLVEGMVRPASLACPRTSTFL